MKNTQVVMVWFLPVIIIGGLFYPLIGYLVLAMMVLGLILTLFKARYWCWNLCPKGAFLDLVWSKITRNKPLPQFFHRQWFRWLIFSIFMVLLIFRVIRTEYTLTAVGAVFTGTCILTTIIAMVLGLMTKHRAWCVICPLGTIQEKIGKAPKK